MNAMTPRTLSSIVVVFVVILAGCSEEPTDSDQEAETSPVAAPERFVGPGGLESLSRRPFRPSERVGTRFLVAGHIYGKPGGPESGAFPAPGFTRAIKRLNAREADLFVSLGDLFIFPSPEMIDRTLTVLGDLAMPVINTPGNHDMVSPAAYEDRFGPTWGAFIDRGSLFCFLNTEIDKWMISGEQLAFFDKTIRNAAVDPSIRRVFVFSHKLIWAQQPRYKDFIGHINGYDGLAGRNNYTSTIGPLLKRVHRKKKPVYWFSGDVGVAPYSFTLFHDIDPKYGVRYVAVGIGDREEDAVLEVDVGAGGDIKMLLHGLGSVEPASIESHDLAFWAARFPPGSPVTPRSAKK